jgi:uncharacterized protein
VCRQPGRTNVNRQSTAKRDSVDALSPVNLVQEDVGLRAEFPILRNKELNDCVRGYPAGFTGPLAPQPLKECFGRGHRVRPTRSTCTSRSSMLRVAHVDLDQAMTEKPPQTRAVLILVGLFFVVWTGWVLLLLRFPVTSSGFILASVRVLVWLGMAIGFIRNCEEKPPMEHLRLQTDVARGISWGVFSSASLLVPSIAYRLYFLHEGFHWRHDASTWLNPILTAPLCEEVLFRGVLFQELRVRFPFLLSALISSLLFSLIHWPYWSLSGSQVGLGLMTSLAGVFIHGMIFSWLLERSQSLWAPLIYHWLNNLVGQSFA